MFGNPPALLWSIWFCCKLNQRRCFSEENHNKLCARFLIAAMRHDNVVVVMRSSTELTIILEPAEKA